MRYIFFVILLLLSAEIFGSKEYFERITSIDGLSQNNVLGICKDSDGYMWFGTYDGLNRYDGYDFKVYRMQGDTNSLSSNLIFGLLADDDDNIWISTFETGICRFNRITEEFTQFKNTDKNPNLLTSNTTRTIYLDSRKRLWVATDKGLNIFIPQEDGSYEIQKITHQEDQKNSLFDNAPQFIYEDSKGRIWVSTFYMLALMKTGENGEIRNEFIYLFEEGRFQGVLQFIEVADGYAFLCNEGIVFVNLNEHNIEKSKIIPFGLHQSIFLQLDHAGNLWTSGYKGLFKYEYKKGLEVPYVLSDHFTEGDTESFLSNEFIRSMLIDETGILWLGTNGAGVLKLNSKKSRFRHYKKTNTTGSLSHNKVFSIFEDRDKNLWFGTEGGGINLLSTKQNKNYKDGFVNIRVNPPGEQNFVQYINDVSNNKTPLIWAGVGYNNKLVQVVNENETWKSEKILPYMSHQIMCICKDEFGNVWLGGYEGGLHKYKSSSIGKELIFYNKENSTIPSNIIRNIVEDSKGRLWIGTSAGLMVLTREQKKNDSLEFSLFLHNSKDSNSISNNYIVPIKETSNNEIWIGTFGRGLNKYNEGSTLTNGTFSILSTKEGLSSNTIKQIIEDDLGNLWITSNNGLTRIDSSRKYIRNFTVDDGLQHIEFIDLSGIKTHDGEILIGGVNGFNAFYPHEIGEDTLKAKVVFNGLEVNGRMVEVNKYFEDRRILSRSLNYTETIILKHTQNNIRIFFSPVHYFAPGSNSAKYMLEGFDSDWTLTSVDSRHVRYTNLNQGKYVFKVLAANSDGLWNSVPRELTIWIKPPFWLTTWFKVSAILSVFIFIALLVFFRFRKIKRSNVILENEVERRIVEIRKMNKVLYKQAKSLNETNAQLEERQQLIEEQAEELMAQKEDLELTNATKDKFYSILAHDLKGPFNALVGNLELLYLRLNKYNAEKRREKIKHSLESSQNLFRLVQNLLQWSRSQRGLIPFNPIELKVLQHVDQVVSIYENMAEEKEVKINYNKLGENLTIFVDLDMFKTILRNLISNAIKYSNPKGEINILASNYELNGKKSVLIKVSDTGVGIPLNVINTIFNVDSNYSTNGTNNEQGTGLGLVLCKEFVLQHKGEIWAESKSGEGTTINFTLPLKRD